MSNDKQRECNVFLFRYNFSNQFEFLTGKQCKQLTDMAIAYMNGKELETDDVVVKVAFSSWKPQLSFDIERKKERKEISQKANAAKQAKRQAKPKETEFVEAEKEERFPFSEFWKLYDKKVGECDCRFAWTHYSDETKEKIMNHVKAYVCARPDKRFRKDPLNYLMDKTWLDEIIDTTENNAAYGTDRSNYKSIKEQEFERNVAVLKDTMARAERGEYADLDPFNAPAKEYWEIQRDMANGGTT